MNTNNFADHPNLSYTFTLAQAADVVIHYQPMLRNANSASTFACIPSGRVLLDGAQVGKFTYWFLPYAYGNPMSFHMTVTASNVPAGTHTVRPQLYSNPYCGASNGFVADDNASANSTMTVLIHAR